MQHEAKAYIYREGEIWRRRNFLGIGIVKAMLVAICSRAGRYARQASAISMARIIERETRRAE